MKAPGFGLIRKTRHAIADGEAEPSRSLPDATGYAGGAALRENYDLF